MSKKTYFWTEQNKKRLSEILQRPEAIDYWYVVREFKDATRDAIHSAIVKFKIPKPYITKKGRQSTMKGITKYSSGTKSGRLKILKVLPKRNFICLCECGNTVKVGVESFRRGYSFKCQCLHGIRR